MKNQVNSTDSRILYAEVSPAIVATDLNCKHFKKLIQTVITEWNNVCSTAGITITELENLCNNNNSQASALSDLLKSKLLAGKEFELNGIRFDIRKLSNIVELPEAVELLRAIEMFKRPAPGNNILYGLNGCNFEWYVIENNKVLVNEQALEQHKDSYRDFATTDAEKARLPRVLQLCAILNELALPGSGLNIFSFDLPNLVDINHANQAVPHRWYITNGTDIDGHVPYSPQVEAVDQKPTFAGIKDVLN